MLQDRFSVALCTYNGDRFLREQLESIITQTVLPAEIVICDDNSSDRTIDIIQSFVLTSPIPVRLFQNTVNLGPAINFFRAIELCCEDWIMLCDQDDIWIQDRVAKFKSMINSFPESNMIVSDGIIFSTAGKSSGLSLFHSFHLTKQEIKLINQGNAPIVLAHHVFATGAGMVVRREWAQKVPLPESDFLHDEWLSWFAGATMRILDTPTFYYRQHRHQVTGIDGSISGQMSHLLHPENKASRSIDHAIERLICLRNAISDSEQVVLNQTQLIIDEKVEFLKKRQQIPNRLFDRVHRIIFTIGIHQYNKFSSGWRTVVKDVVRRNGSRE